jgi:Mn2+/Fe2+ NRAMP family transporter
MLLLILELSDLDYAVKLRSNSSGNVYERKVEDGWFVNPPWIKISGWALGIVIAVLNAFLLWQTFTGTASTWSL